MMKTIYLVAGARPNFMKIAPIVRALQAHGHGRASAQKDADPARAALLGGVMASRVFARAAFIH